MPLIHAWPRKCILAFTKIGQKWSPESPWAHEKRYVVPPRRSILHLSFVQRFFLDHVWRYTSTPGVSVLKSDAITSGEPLSLPLDNPASGSCQGGVPQERSAPERARPNHDALCSLKPRNSNKAALAFEEEPKLSGHRAVPIIARGPVEKAFESTILAKYYLAPFRPSSLRNSALIDACKWVEQAVTRKPGNPFKTAQFIQRLSPKYRDANELTPMQCMHFARQAYLCRAAMNLRGTFERGRDSYGAARLFEVTTLHGGYDLHSAEPPQSARRMAEVASEAATFLREVFPEEVQARIREGRGSFVDKNTGLVATFLFEHQAQARKPTIHVVFSGTGAAGQMASHAAADIAMLTNSRDIPPSFIQARNIVEMVRTFAGDRANVEVKGFSLGGAHAVYAGLANEVRTTTLAPLALSPALWKNLVNEKGERLEHLVAMQVTNLVIERDIASGHPMPSRVSRAIEQSIGIKMPHILGTTYMIPAESIPDNYRSPSIGLGVHSSAGRIWADFARARCSADLRRKAGDTVTGTGTPLPAGAGLEDPEARVDELRDPAEAEHRLLAAIEKFRLKAGGNAGLGSFRLRRLVNQVTSLSRHYAQLAQAERLRKLGEIEQSLGMMRNDRVVRSTITGVRDMYAAVVSERNRLLEPPTQGTPEDSRALLSGIAEAARAAGAGTIGADNLETKNNKVMQAVLHTGDEIGPAVYDLVRNAQRSVQLQTYLFYEKSESAKWLHKGLDELQTTQLRKRAAGELVEPINVEIFLDDSQGLARQNLPGDGGRQQKAQPLKGRRDAPRKNEVSNYGIGYPAKLDPSLVRLTVCGLRHFDRGSLHSKTALVDNEIALVSTNNFKGTHHSTSMDGEPRFDAGIVFSGGACAAIGDDLASVAALTRGNVLGSNEREDPVDDKNQAAYLLPRAHYPAPAGGEVKLWTWTGLNPNREQQRVDKILAMLQQFRDSGLDTGKQRIVALSKPVDSSFYSRSNDSPQRAAFLHALRNASSHIRIANVNLNVQEVIDALVEATRRGVHVEASPRGELPGKGSGSENHAKYMNVDGVAIIGSTNLDEQSWKYSAETSIAIVDRETVDLLDRDCFVELFRHGVPFKPALPGIAELFRNHAGPLQRRYDERMAARLPFAPSVFTGGEKPSSDRRFLDNIGSGHIFKWVSTPSSARAVNLAIRFTSRQQGYEQVKHSTVVHDESLASAGMAVLTENPDGSKTLVVNNESGHYRPSFKSLAEASPTRVKWEEVAAQLQQQLGALVRVRFEAFTGDDAQSLERFRGTLSEDLVSRRLRFLQRVAGDTDKTFSSKLLRGEMLLCLDKVSELLSRASTDAGARQSLGIDTQDSLRQLVMEASNVLDQVKARKSLLSPRWRRRADILSGLLRKGPNNSERPHEQLMRLHREIAALRAQLSVPTLQAAQSQTEAAWQETELHRVLRALQSHPQTHVLPPSKASRNARHADRSVQLDEQRIAKAIIASEADVYRRFAPALQGAICEHRLLSDDQFRESLAQEQQQRILRLQRGEPDKEIIALSKVGAKIRQEHCRELSIKVGRTPSLTQIRQGQRRGMFLKRAKLAATDLLTGSRSAFGTDRNARLMSISHHGEHLGGGRIAVGRRTSDYFRAAVDLPAPQRAATLNKIAHDLELIRRRLADAPVAFIGSSVLIAIDEVYPENTKVKLVDLAHAVQRNNPLYAHAAHEFDHGIKTLLAECTELRKR
ncbi:hypothetical protein DFQ28_010490 [Apophysomyces sp. BC1034]|nr:hypothetical protein DFQ28_010490 [Apophysomyces sp. BC1034]